MTTLINLIFPNFRSLTFRNLTEYITCYGIRLFPIWFQSPYYYYTQITYNFPIHIPIWLTWKKINTIILNLFGVQKLYHWITGIAKHDNDIVISTFIFETLHITMTTYWNLILPYPRCNFEQWCRVLGMRDNITSF